MIGRLRSLSSPHPAISVQGVSKQYRRTRSGFRLRTLKSVLLQRSLTDGLAEADVITALCDVSFEVGAGEAFGLVGGNGSGKSTLLKLVAGLMKPSAGKIELAGRVAPLIELGAGFHPEISGLENIFINGAVLGLKRREIEQRLDSIVAFSGLEDFIDEPVKNYSSGMYVRLGFAVAVHTDPEILLVDEVLAVGDEAFAHKCITRIEEHLADGGTLLFVSHSLDLVERICDRVLWLDRGQSLAQGEPREVIDAYRQAVALAEGREHLEAHRAASVKETSLGSSEPPSEQGQADPDRWGSGQAVLLSTRMMVAGEESYLIESGQPVDFEIEVEARQPLDDFVFGIGVSTPRGVECWGTNTDLMGLESERLEGRARIRISCSGLRLAAGEYEVDLAVHSRDGAPYDYRRRCLSFVVQSNQRGVGVYRPELRWHFSGGVAFQEGRMRPARERTAARPEGLIEDGDRDSADGAGDKQQRGPGQEPAQHE